MPNIQAIDFIKFSYKTGGKTASRCRLLTTTGKNSGKQQQGT
jgi:hypothetical protein